MTLQQHKELSEKIKALKSVNKTFDSQKDAETHFENMVDIELLLIKDFHKNSEAMNYDSPYTDEDFDWQEAEKIWTGDRH